MDTPGADRFFTELRADTPIDIFGDQALLTHWLKHTPY